MTHAAVGKDGEFLTATDEGIERLRYEIVRLAVMDYDSALKWLRKHPQSKCVTESQKSLWSRKNALKNECEGFFRSKWFPALCDIDGEVLMRTVRQKYYNRQIRWTNRKL